MKILLINPYIAEDLGSFLPLGLSYIARALLQEGHNIEVWDLNAQPLSNQQLKAKLENSEFDLIGISGMIWGHRYIKKLVPLIRELKLKTKIVLGGSFATSISQYIFQELDIDYIVLGEGEETIVELVQCLETKGNLKKIEGLMYKQGDMVVATQPRAFCPNLDKFGFPAWELLPMDDYKKSPNYNFINEQNDNTNTRDIGIISSRGCCYRCSYCDHQIKGHNIRMHSLDYVLEEIKILMSRYNIRHFFFWDDIFTFNKKRVMNFCQRVIDEGLDISWTCNSHANHSDYEMYSQMKKAGCFSIRFGIESGSQRILDAYNKKVKVEQAMKAIRRACRAGLITVLYIMVGMIGETEETINDTYEFIAKTFKPLDLNFTPPTIQYFYVTPIPGTSIFEQAQALGKIGSLKSYLEKNHDFMDRLTINLTDMPNERLVSLRKGMQHNIDNLIIDRYHRLKSIALELGEESGLKL